jgi:uncharacterized protein (TIGR00369 family)
MAEPTLEIFRELFRAAPFVAFLGIELEAISSGRCHTRLHLRPEHLQETGLVHAGVIAAIADHTAGAAAGSVLDRLSYPLTVEFNINLLRRASGDHLTCHSRVLKPGRTLVVAESEVFIAGRGVDGVLVAKALVTLAVLTKVESRGTGAF